MLSKEILKYFPADYKGTIIEIGAGFPKMGNPIFGLREIGWNIISIEPNPVFCSEYIALGYNILQYACYSSDVGSMEFTITPNGLSGSSLVVSEKKSVVIPDLSDEFNESTAKGNGLSDGFDWKFFPKNNTTKTIIVEALTLTTILKKHYPDIESVDIIIIDVEGFELDVLKGINLKKLNPKLLIVENIPSDPEHYEYMLEQGYIVSSRVDINDFYVKTIYV